MTDEQIERFFNKQCTEQEARQIAEYLSEHPQLLDKYLNAAEWFDAGAQPMNEQFWNDSWVAVKRRQAAQPALLWLKRAAVAAAIVLAGSLIWKNTFTSSQHRTLAAVHQASVPVKRKITVNNTAEMMHIFLPDSSTIALSPGSLITYSVPSESNKRSITLDGQARFAVAKDEHRPFTVYAGGLATTALGTEFTIDTRHNVSVRLHNGRVMITATGETMKHWKNKVILEPGQQLSFDSKDMTAAVGIIPRLPAIAHNLPVKKQQRPSAPVSHGMNFVNTALPEVMDRLMDCYRDKISFDSTELSGMNFTGTISASDSLQIVLKVIAQMNDLQVDRNENGYAIKKAEK